MLSPLFVKTDLVRRRRELLNVENGAAVSVLFQAFHSQCATSNLGKLGEIRLAKPWLGLVTDSGDHTPPEVWSPYRLVSWRINSTPLATRTWENLQLTRRFSVMQC